MRGGQTNCLQRAAAMKSSGLQGRYFQNRNNLKWKHRLKY